MISKSNFINGLIAATLAVFVALTVFAPSSAQAQNIQAGDTISLTFDGQTFAFDLLDVQANQLIAEIGGQQFVLTTNITDLTLVNEGNIVATLEGNNDLITITVGGVVVIQENALNIEDAEIVAFIIQLIGSDDAITQANAQQRQTDTTLRTTTRTITGRVSAIVSSAILSTGQSADTGKGFGFGNVTGVNTGDGPVVGYGVWASPSYTSVRDKNTGQAFNGDSAALMAGGDIILDNGFILGGAISIEDTALTLISTDGTLDRTGSTAILYGAKVLDDTFAIDGFVGVGLSYSERADAFGTADFDGRLFLTGVNGTAVTAVDDVEFLGSLGLSYAHDRNDAYTTSAGFQVREQTAIIGRSTLSGQVKYTAFSYMDPYAGLAVEYDFNNNSSVADKAGFVARAGFDFKKIPGFTATAEYNGVFDRDAQHEHSLLVNTRWDF